MLSGERYCSLVLREACFLLTLYVKQIVSLIALTFFILFDVDHSFLVVVFIIAFQCFTELPIYCGKASQTSACAAEKFAS